jgi:tripartite-type tricarboxylate transporter receptor subunit TctC
MSFKKTAIVALAGLGLMSVAPMAVAWEPSKPVEFVVPAGTGGGADQMARFIQGVVQKYNLMKQPMVVVNRPGGAGAEGFVDVLHAKGDPHKLVISLSNLFTTPLATGVPFDWDEFTPIAMLALDQFVLWVNADTPYKATKDYIDAIKAAPDGTFKMGGTGSKQEDQIITVKMEKILGKRITYIPFKGGGDVAVQLVGKHVNSTVNNPIEAESHWRAGKLRALCVMDDELLPYKDKVTATQSWADVPTCKSAGIDIDYLMLRGVLAPPKLTPDQVAFYVDLFKKVRATPEWADFMNRGAYKQQFMAGKEYNDWLKKAAAEHFQLMKEAGFIAK